MKPPRVYAAIAAVARDVSVIGLAKNGVNEEDGYRFRGIDDIYNLLSPLLAKRRLCILPRVLSTATTAVRSRGGEALTRVTTSAAFDFICAADGSTHTVETAGEALDASDKATNKALTAAYKSAVFQVFCIPVLNDESEARTYRLRAASPTQVQEPVQGWVDWADDLMSMIDGCETKDALDRVCHRYKRELSALAQHAVPSFRALGSRLQARERALQPTAGPT